MKYRDLKDNRGYTNGDGKKKTWSDEEVVLLKQLLQAGTSRKEIFKHFLKRIPLRSSYSVSNKIKHLQKKFVNELSQQTEEHDKKLEEKRKFEQEIYDLLLTKDETKDKTEDEGGKKPKKPRTKLKL